MKKLIVIFLVTLALMGVVEGAKIIANGATSQSITVVIDTNDGDPNVLVTIADLDLFVQLDGPYTESTKVDLVAHAAVTDAWDDGEAIHMGHGLYRIDIPDANLSNGIGSLLTYIIDDTVGSNRTTYYEVQLSPRVDANTVSGSAPINQTLMETYVETACDASIGGGTGTSLTGIPNLDQKISDVNTTLAAAVGGASAEEVWEDPNAVTTAAITDAVWDEASSDHNTSGTTGWLLRRILDLLF